MAEQDRESAVTSVRQATLNVQATDSQVGVYVYAVWVVLVREWRAAASGAVGFIRRRRLDRQLCAADRRLQTELVCDGEDVIAELLPVVTARRFVGVTVSALIERHDAEDCSRHDRAERRPHPSARVVPQRRSSERAELLLEPQDRIRSAYGCVQVAHIGTQLAGKSDRTGDASRPWFPVASSMQNFPDAAERFSQTAAHDPGSSLA